MFHAAHTEDGECDISSPKIEEAYAQLVSEKDLQWLLLSYTRSNGCSLDVTTTGKDFDALMAYMKDDAVHFVIVKVVAGNSTYGVVEKFILITWVGKKVAPTKRSKASRHKKVVSTIVKAGLAAEVHTSTADDVKEASLLQKLYSSRSAIHSNPPLQTNPTHTSGNGNLPKPPPKRVEFDTSPSKPTPSKIKPGPVPSRPVPTNPLQQSKEKEEKERKEKEEKERVERERIEQEKKEKEQRERAEKEKLEKERLEKEKLEKERLEKEKLEKERLEKERLEKEKLEKEKLEKERQEKERQEKFKRDQEAAAAVAAFQPKPKPSPLHNSSPTKPGGGSVDHNHLSVPKTPEKPGELSGDLMVKEMGRLGRKMGVSPHPPRRATPPATPSLPHHAKKPPPKVLSFGMGSLQGKRPSMEDRHVALLSLPKNPKLAYFGIYDGHQGEEAADFAAENLHSEVDKYLTLVDSKYGGDKHKALVQAFITLDENFNDEASTNYWDSGTTAIVALFDTENKKILAVNVGDSRCVLGRGGKAISLSEDHKPWVEKEKERILAAGKTIEDNRVNGSHAFSRSIGDREMKDDLLEPHEQAICPIPEFHEAEMSKDPSEREFLILACDGLWDVMSNAEAVHWVDQKLENEDNLDTVAAELAQHAIDIGSTDNVSILIVALPK